MRTLLAILLFSLVSATSQDTNNLPDIRFTYVWVRNVANVYTAMDRINTAYGYPNLATLTYRTVDWDLLSNGTNALVRIDHGYLWSPRFNRYLHLDTVFQELYPDVDTTICTNVTQLAGKAVARVSGDLARKIGYYITKP